MLTSRLKSFIGSETVVRGAMYSARQIFKVQKQRFGDVATYPEPL